MKIGAVVAISLVLSFGIAARPDTITFKNNLSVNGSVVGLSGGVITLNARFPSGTKTLEYPIGSVQIIEFNSNTNNMGAPPKVLGIAPGNSGAAAPPDILASDVIVLRGDDRRPCKLLKIDATRVYCDAKDSASTSSSFGRTNVLRIRVDSQ